jgi:hypothetical protein
MLMYVGKILDCATASSATSIVEVATVDAETAAGDLDYSLILSHKWTKYGQFDRARSGSSARLPAPIEE